jgi:hypothetical protein
MLKTTELLTKSEAAEFLAIRPRTLDCWRDAGVIPCIERPGYVRFLKSDLDAFLHSHRVEARKGTPYRPRRRRPAPAPPAAK